METHTENHPFKTIVDFRPAHEGDVVAISKICYLNQASKEYWCYQLYAYLRNKFNPHHALPDRIIYVALYKSSVIGFIAGHCTRCVDYPGHIQWIAVARDYQRNGIGAELLWMLAGWFIEKNILCVRADVERWQADLINFYDSQKAVRVNSRGLYWGDIRTVMRN